MTTGVNLVPTSFLHACARAGRRRRWIGTCSVLLVLLGAGWGIQRAAALALGRLSEAVAGLDVQRSEVQRRFITAGAQRTQLIERLQTIAAARHPQPWAERLTRLTREAPEGVVLTAVNIGTPTADAARTAQARDAKPATARPDRPAPAPATTSDPLSYSVRILGYALDHPSLIQFINTLQGAPGWQHVELVRATQEPYRGGSAVAFELDCRTLEARP